MSVEQCEKIQDSYIDHYIKGRRPTRDHREEEKQEDIDYFTGELPRQMKAKGCGDWFYRESAKRQGKKTLQKKMENRFLADIFSIRSFFQDLFRRNKR
ncbi:MAG TPA: hypothetical protein DF383_06985 [Deltaproteobacteria bacterium]|nr:hypothetical protein [Deltaproteobacteria bacterium]